jgi:nucleoside-diphosphate-sugar epimerase
MHHDAMVWRPRQTMDTCLDVPRDHCDVGWGSGRSELWTHALSIHGETCSRFGNSRAIFNAANLYARLSIKLGREVAMSFYVVVGAGPVGRETARLLGEEGHDVVLTSRSVGSNALTNVRTIQADATDASELSRICRGADAIFMCAMAAYDRWSTDFFPIIDGTVRAAEAVGAKLVVLGNLYGYGENADSPLRSDLPLDPTSRKGTVRTIMWQRAVRADIPAIEIRSSDYLGHGAISYFSLVALPSIIEGKPTAFIGDLDATHAWTFTKDVARTLVAAARYKGKWGRAFHVPSQYASPRELIQKTAAMLGREVSGARSYSASEIETLGMHEAIEMSYLFESPLLVDSSDTEALLGVKASSLEEMIADTLRNHL